MSDLSDALREYLIARLGGKVPSDSSDETVAALQAAAQIVLTEQHGDGRVAYHRHDATGEVVISESSEEPPPAA